MAKNNTGYKYISCIKDSRFVFQPPASAKLEQRNYSYDTLDEAIEGRNELLGYDPDQYSYEEVQRGEVNIQIPSPEMTEEDLWDHVINYQEKSAARDNSKEWNEINISGDKPIALAWLSDIHFGGPHVDYKAVKRDTEIITSTPGFYAEFHGDLADNWIIGKLQAIQRYQIMQQKQELALALSWLRQISPKLLWVVSGNHDLWIEKLSGIDMLSHYAQPMGDLRYLYDRYELRVKLQFENTGAEWKVITRHDWRGKSKYNPTHGIENAWRFGSYEFDIGIGGHTHQGTFARPFAPRAGMMAWAILTGTYKRRDSYQEQLGLPKTTNDPTGASIFHPDGRQEFFYSVRGAADYLTYLRNKK